LAQLNAIAQIGAEPAGAVLAIITGGEPDPAAGTSDTSTWNHHSLEEFRRGLMSAAVYHHKVAGEYEAVWDKPRGERLKSECDAHAGSLMAGSYAYVLAAVLRVAAEEFGPQTARRLADVADCILADGDGEDLNADVKPGAPLPPPSPAEQAAAGQMSIWDAQGAA
jgi:hypothetical protein